MILVEPLLGRKPECNLNHLVKEVNPPYIDVIHDPDDPPTVHLFDDDLEKAFNELHGLIKDASETDGDDNDTEIAQQDPEGDQEELGEEMLGYVLREMRIFQKFYKSSVKNVKLDIQQIEACRSAEVPLGEEQNEISLKDGRTPATSQEIVDVDFEYFDPKSNDLHGIAADIPGMSVVLQFDIGADNCRYRCEGLTRMAVILNI